MLEAIETDLPLRVFYGNLPEHAPLPHVQDATFPCASARKSSPQRKPASPGLCANCATLRTQVFCGVGDPAARAVLLGPILDALVSADDPLGCRNDPPGYW
jgi:hypothetical protein